MPLARYNHCAAALAPGGMFVCGGVVGAVNDMPVRGKELTIWWDAEEQGWLDVSVSQRCRAFNPQCFFVTTCAGTPEAERLTPNCHLRHSLASSITLTWFTRSCA
jgi:hypothetical protein